MQRIGIVGAGLTGAVLARELAEKGYACLVVDERDHCGGNCHTRRDPDTGVMHGDLGLVRSLDVVLALAVTGRPWLSLILMQGSPGGPKDVWLKRVWKERAKDGSGQGA